MHRPTQIAASTLALASLALFASSASAQSSVTLYGLVDNGINYLNNAGGHSQYQMTSSSGQIQGSRWGLRGVEALGDGNAAIFQLENGFDTDTGKLGQQGDEFGRLAVVGLQGKYGKLMAGRQYAEIIDYVGATMIPSGIWGGTFVAHAGDVDNLNDSFRVNNAVKYTSNSYGGFTASAMYSFGGQAGAFNRNGGWGVGGGYAMGPLTAGVAFQVIEDPYLAAYNNGANAPAAVATPIYSGYVSAHSLQIFAAAAMMRIGDATVGADYSNTRFKDLGSDAGLGATPGLHGTASFNVFELHGGYKVTPFATLFAALSYTRRGSVDNDSGAGYSQAALGADYRLSKRTDLYASVAYQHATGTDSTGHAATAALANGTPSTTDRQVGARIGLRHTF